jgi:tRNA threonylcarbamoyladenosine biosynthesis protein TsaE
MMQSPSAFSAARHLDLADQAATERLAGRLAEVAAAGDVIALWGDLGAGKSTFARAYIRALAEARGVDVDEVPSPTFTIVQIYDDLRPAVWHVDLFRLNGPEDTRELGLEEAQGNAVLLIEWPDQLASELPPDRLDLHLGAGPGDNARRADLADRGASTLAGTVLD